MGAPACRCALPDGASHPRFSPIWPCFVNSFLERIGMFAAGHGDRPLFELLLRCARCGHSGNRLRGFMVGPDYGLIHKLIRKIFLPWRG